MKILITTDWYAPIINGVVTSVLNLQNELEREGHEVMILTLSDSHESYCEGNVIYVGSINAERVYPNARIRLRFSSKWLNKIVEWKPDVIHSQCEFSTFTIARRVSSWLGIPIVHTYHTIYEDYTHYFSPTERVGKTAVRFFTREICQRVNHVIAPTEKTEQLLNKYQIEKPVSVIPTGLVLNKFSGCKKISREQWNIPNDETVLIYVGRLAKEKQLDLILGYLRDYEGEKITLMIVGDGPHREELEQEVKSVNGNVTVIFAGMVPQDEVQSYYTLGDLFVSASQSETQGLTYIEAAASGLPLLCKKDSCLEAVIEQGKNGWQFETEEEFMQSVEKFIHMTADERREMSENSVTQAQKFDIRNTVPEIVEIYKKAVETHVRVKRSWVFRKIGKKFRQKL